MSDLVSIIMPTFNCGVFISNTINSVLAQTYTCWELIIVDDCSNDNTFEIVESIRIKDSRVKYIILDRNSGAAVSRTIAMKNAKGKYIAFLDSDDIWLPLKLEMQVNFMIKNNYTFTCTQYSQIDELGNSLNRVIKVKEKTDYNGVLLNCPIGNSTVIYNVEKLGKFEVPNIRKRNDDALWLQILKREKYIYGLNETLTNYRVRENSISSNKISLIRYHWILYRDIEKLSICRSIFHIVTWGFIKLFRMK